MMEPTPVKERSGECRGVDVFLAACLEKKGDYLNQKVRRFEL